MTTYRLFPSASGPASVASASGGWLLGVIFSVTGGMRWFDGYWIWNPSDGDAAARKCALWTQYSTTAQSVVPGSVVTSGALTQGAWNYVALPSPVQLAPGALYVAAVGWTATAGIPVTSGAFTGGGAYAAGIVNGPLTAWSAPGGSNAFPAATVNYNLGQGLFSNVLGADPSAAMPNNGSGSDNLWVDVQVDDTAPGGYSGSYRFHPNQADLGNFAMDTANMFTLGKEFVLGAACNVDNVWFYSPATVSQLPTEVGVYRVSDTTLVASNSSPSWSGAAGSGWISAPLAGSLASGVSYKVVVGQFAANVIWNAAVANYWSTGFGANGLVAGPLSAPNNASATSPGQESYNLGTSLTFPGTNAGPYAYGLDIEVTPSTSYSGSGSAALSLRALAAGASHRSGTGSAALSLAATATAGPPAATVKTGSWWGLYNVLQERAEYAAYYRSQAPVACPNDGTPLLKGPPESPEAELYCPFDGWVFPRDYDPDIHSGM